MNVTAIFFERCQHLRYFASIATEESSVLGMHSAVCISFVSAFAVHIHNVTQGHMMMC